MHKTRHTTIIFTAAAESGRIALAELQRASKNAQLLDWLAPGVGRVDMGIGWESLVDALQNRPPIFVRHICPAQITVSLEQKTSDLNILSTAAKSLVNNLDPSQSFSVQTRLLGDHYEFGRFNVNQRLAAVLEKSGAPLDVRQPAQVLSVVCTQHRAYLGLSPASENLSDWAGGERRFKHEAGQISRSEFKLLEAMELFDMEFPSGGLALDLGAAPGGWTRILRRHAMQVIAIDPADLHPSIESDPAITHQRQLAMDYLSSTKASHQFDVVLNDMRMDARDSARLMAQAASYMKPGCLVVMTLKLPGRGMQKVTAQALNILRRPFKIIGARQLFHNRSEITVGLTPKHTCID
jgi:23S rRNA (cytidine2498-2'-O)-methyltransferase